MNKVIELLEANGLKRVKNPNGEFLIEDPRKSRIKISVKELEEALKTKPETKVKPEVKKTEVKE